MVRVAGVNDDVGVADGGGCGGRIEAVVVAADDGGGGVEVGEGGRDGAQEDGVGPIRVRRVQGVENAAADVARGASPVHMVFSCGVAEVVEMGMYRNILGAIFGWD